jgi:hypothetical protein
VRQRGAGACGTVDCCHERESQTHLWEARAGGTYRIFGQGLRSAQLTTERAQTELADASPRFRVLGAARDPVGVHKPATSKCSCLAPAIFGDVGRAFACRQTARASARPLLPRATPAARTRAPPRRTAPVPTHPDTHGRTRMPGARAQAKRSPREGSQRQIDRVTCGTDRLHPRRVPRRRGAEADPVAPASPPQQLPPPYSVPTSSRKSNIRRIHSATSGDWLILRWFAVLLLPTREADPVREAQPVKHPPPVQQLRGASNHTNQLRLAGARGYPGVIVPVPLTVVVTCGGLPL